MPSSYRNISFATAASAGAVMSEGKDVVARGCSTKEILNRITALEKPLERFIFVPERLNNVFGQVAETMWVIAGRNDVDWLELYLPRAKEFSDDGKTWRAGYGPRLRRWHGNIDQLSEVRKILLTDRTSRRAVMSIYDPGADFAPSKDIPCNNWLSWIIRDDHLHLNVAIRSNDLMWGFSGANAFEWSVLHEMIALWTGTIVGPATYFATSFHLYERHFETAKKIVDRFHGLTPYNFGVKSEAFGTPWERFDEALEEWFAVEEKIRNDPEAPLGTSIAMSDPFLANGLALLRLKWGSANWTDEILGEALAALPENDFAVAAYEYFGRSKPTLLTHIPQLNIARFFQECSNRTATVEPSFKEAIKALHSRKSKAYGCSWKKRGERISVLPNIARKIDRLQVFVESGHHLSDESVLDTALDLYVYVAKYRLLLTENERSQNLLPVDAPSPFSDRDDNFDYLVDLADFEGHDSDLATSIHKAVDSFEKLWPAVDANETVDVKQAHASELYVAAQTIIAALAKEDRHLVSTFVQAEIGSKTT